MYYDNSTIENTINAVKQTIFVDYGITLQMAVVTNTIRVQPILEIRWEEGEERFQASKVLSSYPTVGPPEYSWRETARMIADELRQNIKDTRTRRMNQWNQQPDRFHKLHYRSSLDAPSAISETLRGSEKAIPGANVYERPATINESFKCDNTSKTLLLC